MGAPVNGIVEIAGPEQFRLDELVRDTLAVRLDQREVIPDPEARYYGARLEERSLLPGPAATLAGTRVEDWLGVSLTTPM